MKKNELSATSFCSLINMLPEEYSSYLQTVEFEQKTIDELSWELKMSGNARPLIAMRSLKSNDGFISAEKPNTEKCLMSLNCLPNSFNKTFIEQTQLLASFAEFLFPQLIKKPKWIQCCKEFSDCCSNIKKDALENNIETCRLFSSLLINKYFRPSANEIVQQIKIATEKKQFLYLKELTLSNTIHSSTKGSFTKIGVADVNGISAIHQCIDEKNSLTGVSFICSINTINYLFK